MGFAATLDAILSNLPRERQTLLFSATQTKSVKTLARLSLSDPQVGDSKRAVVLGASGAQGFDRLVATATTTTTTTTTHAVPGSAC